MKFIAILFALVAFLAIAVGVLAAIGPSGALSILYIFFAAIFSTALFNTIKGKTYSAGNSPSRALTRKSLFVASLLGLLGSVGAFFVYWVTKDHLVSARTFIVFVGLSVLFVFILGRKIEPH